MSLIKKLAGETMIYGMGSVLPRILNFIILTPYLTNVLDTGAYGILGILYAYLAVLLYFFTLKLDTAFFRFATISESKTEAFTTSIITIVSISVVLVSIIFWKADVIAELLIADPAQAHYIKWFALILAFDAIASVPFAKLRLENRPIKFAVIKIINVVITAGLILFFLELSPLLSSSDSSFLSSIYDPNKKLDYVFIANVIASGCVLLLLGKEILSYKLKFHKSLFTKMIKYAWPLILIGAVGAVNIAFDREFISKLLPGTPAENLVQSGIYNGSIKIAVLMSLFATAFNYAAEPFFFKTFKERDSKEIYPMVALAFTISAGFVFLVITLNIDIIQYLIGKSFRGALEIVPIILMAYIFLGLYYNFSIWYKLKDKTIYGAFIALGGLLIFVSSNLILIPNIGYIGAAWSVLACFIFYSSAAYLTGRKHFPIEYPIGRIVSVLVFALALFFVNQYLTTFTESTVLRFVVSSLSLIFYLFVNYKWHKDLVDELALTKPSKNRS